MVVLAVARVSVSVSVRALTFESIDLETSIFDKQISGQSRVPRSRSRGQSCTSETKYTQGV